MAARGKKPGKKQDALLTALEFVGTAQRAVGSLEQTHCRIFGGWVMASNGVVSAAHPITEDVSAAPATHRLTDALRNAPGAVSMTLMDAERLSVRSGDFQAVVPCIDPAVVPTISPDGALSLCDNRLADALQVAGALVVEGAEKVVNCSVQIRGTSVMASNGTVILEAWHGVNMPSLVIVPKMFITALGKIKKPIARFGFCDFSFTLWFDDNSWLKTQVYPTTTNLPNLEQYLNIDSTPVPVPKQLFEVVKRLEPFSEDGQVYFTADGARVTSGQTFAIDQLKNVPVGFSFSIKGLLSIAPYCETIHFNAAEGITLFFSKTKLVRGAIVNGRV
jgi:hypothetical protein